MTADTTWALACEAGTDAFDASGSATLQSTIDEGDVCDSSTEYRYAYSWTAVAVTDGTGTYDPSAITLTGTLDDVATSSGVEEHYSLNVEATVTWVDGTAHTVATRFSEDSEGYWAAGEFTECGTSVSYSEVDAWGYLSWSWDLEADSYVLSAYLNNDTWSGYCTDDTEWLWVELDGVLIAADYDDWSELSDVDGDLSFAEIDDCDDANRAVSPFEAEICDGVDQDCDGTADDGVTTTFYADADGDGFGDSASTAEACALPSGYAEAATHCDDANATAFPGATEHCNTLDDDCDGAVDEDDAADALTWYADADVSPRRSPTALRPGSLGAEAE